MPLVPAGRARFDPAGGLHRFNRRLDHVGLLHLKTFDQGEQFSVAIFSVAATPRIPSPPTPTPGCSPRVSGQTTKLSFLSHVHMNNRSNPEAAPALTPATGIAELEAAMTMLVFMPPTRYSHLKLPPCEFAPGTVVIGVATAPRKNGC
jgi:hypothetical protein